MAMGFLKKGKAALALHKKADEQQEAKKAAYDANAVRRFFIPKDLDEEKQITFLDGGLDDEGMLEANSFWEHNLKLNGKWNNTFPCTQLEEPCPICEGGDTPYLVSVFTIIDHSSWTDNKGVTHKNERKLFPAKREVFKRLQKIAAKRDGLAGCTFDVSRTGGDKSPATGDTFEFVEKRTTAAIKKAFKMEAEDVEPFDYEEVITCFTAKELRKQGFGEAGSTLGSEGNMGGGDEDEEDAPKKPKAKKTAKKSDDADDYSNEV